MRKLLVVALLVVLVRGLPGCASCEPDENMTIQVTAGPDLNTYAEGSRMSAHALDLYVFKVDEPETFLANDPGKLAIADQGAVPGGQGLGRFEVIPGEKPLLNLGKSGSERWTHIGIYAAYGAPANTAEAVKRVIEIPSDCGADLLLAGTAIETFGNE